jgi:hypothetical protein
MAGSTGSNYSRLKWQCSSHLYPHFKYAETARSHLNVLIFNTILFASYSIAQKAAFVRLAAGHGRIRAFLFYN